MFESQVGLDKNVFHCSWRDKKFVVVFHLLFSYIIFRSRAFCVDFSYEIPE